MSYTYNNFFVEPILADARRRARNAGNDAGAHANSAESEDAPPQPHAALISDLESAVSSPEDERDEVDVLNELLAGSHGTGTQTWSRRFQGSGSYSSLRSRASIPDDRMSINPAHDVAGSLRSLSYLSNAHTDMTGVTSSSRTDVEQNMEANGAQDEGQEHGLSARTEAPRMEGSLPHDDGMRALRQKLQEIRILAISTEEKARRMHYLMTLDYLAHKADVGTLHSMGDDTTPTVSGSAPSIDPANPYNLRPVDIEPSFSPPQLIPREASGDREESVDEILPPMLGCTHYKRNVKVQCFDCHRWFPCRHCHDQAPDLPFVHQLNRQKTRNMLCMLCRTPQPAAEVCVNCNEYTAWYYCPKCKLWDNDSNKRIYHCDDCGICRVGEGLGKDFAHCKRCNVCISISTEASHPCVERATEGDCPLCLVRLFESPTPVVSLPCGHYMHGVCYRDLMAVTYKCPVCSKSAVNMELQWRKLDDEISVQPMPEEDVDLVGLLPHADDATTAHNEETHTPEATRRPRTVYIGCNDCSRRSWTPFHWLGLKCQVCDSYNTNQMAPTAFEETEAERLVRQQQQRHRQHDFTGDGVLRDAGIGADETVPISDMLEVPTSPSMQPVGSDSGSRPGSAPHSPGRRYFIQPEEERRPNINPSRFSTSSIPTLPNFPELPRMPRMPNLPNLPDMPNFPYMRNMPNMPNMPNLELPRFYSYEMFADAVSRSLSPMRNYLQGYENRDGDGGEGDLRYRRRTRARNFSPTSVRSDPTPDVVTDDASDGKRRPASMGQVGDGGEENIGFWAAEGQFLSGEEDGSEGSASALEGGRGRGDEMGSSSESELTDTEMADDDDDDDDDPEGVNKAGDLELIGHR